eukprot:GDKI01026583.1.p2 GENE.GDKI01026583.1~~GDKI01026583.1.p2  ORF type:complete len:118 (-),score=26.69 GDKI01026583.1:23-376(-)
MHHVQKRTHTDTRIHTRSLAHTHRDAHTHAEREREMREFRMAVLFRAFTFTNCLGNMNDLFSGNGQTYSASGGLMSATGNEIISAPFDVGGDGIDVRYVYFCVNGRGRPNENGMCVD